MAWRLETYHETDPKCHRANGGLLGERYRIWTFIEIRFQTISLVMRTCFREASQEAKGPYSRAEVSTVAGATWLRCPQGVGLIFSRRRDD